MIFLQRKLQTVAITALSNSGIKSRWHAKDDYGPEHANLFDQREASLIGGSDKKTIYPLEMGTVEFFRAG